METVKYHGFSEKTKQGDRWRAGFECVLCGILRLMSFDVEGTIDEATKHAVRKGHSVTVFGVPSAFFEQARDLLAINKWLSPGDSLPVGIKYGRNKNN